MHHNTRRLLPSTMIAAAALTAAAALAPAPAPARSDMAQTQRPSRPDPWTERQLDPQPEPPGIAAVRRVSPAAGRTAKAPRQDPWRRVVTKPYTPERLGLAPDASARALARAAIKSSARTLGLRSVRRIRLASEFAPPGASSAGRQLHTLRFQQSVGGLRVLWSEIDVAVVDGAVTSISATTVPFTHTRLQGRRRVSRARARVLAKRALAGSETALPAQAVAYAGTPAKPWAPRRAWVVQLQPAKQARGADHAETICVVVDAASGKLIMRYKGFVSQDTQPQSGVPLAGSAVTASFASIFDAYGGTGFGDELARWNGDPRPGGTMSFEPMLPDLVTHDGARQAIFPVASVLGPTCKRRGFCAGYSVIHGQKVGPQTIIANSGSPIGSHYSTNGDIITLETKHADDEDVIAHEFGHRRDFEWADERVDGHQQVDEVEEALADMFAYDVDFHATIGEDTKEDFPGDRVTAGFRNLADPHLFKSNDIDDPATMSEYRCASDTDEHINATILGHAYYLFADQVGHPVAGDVLTYIPYALPAAPNFNDVAFWFAQRSQELYGPAVRDAAINAFRTQAGIGTQTPAGHGCGSPGPQTPTPPKDLACEKQNPPPSCFPGPPTRPELDATE